MNKHKFHVKVNDVTVVSHETYDTARWAASAQLHYDGAADGTKVEIVHMSALVWGPYIKGGKYNV